jgi:hypothetical protein
MALYIAVVSDATVAVKMTSNRFGKKGETMSADIFLVRDQRITGIS